MTSDSRDVLEPVEADPRASLTAERIETAGHPLAYGEWLGAPRKPTVPFYGKYDVQPVDPVELWRHPPFEPTVEGDRLVAHGSTDDKGQSYAHVKSVAAMFATRGKLPVNVKFLVEGEEESCSEATGRFVREDHGKKLACDCVMISDSSLFGPGQPALTYGLKALAYMELKVTGLKCGPHSGTFGGAVTNPLNALCRIVARRPVHIPRRLVDAHRVGTLAGAGEVRPIVGFPGDAP